MVVPFNQSHKTHNTCLLFLVLVHTDLEVEIELQNDVCRLDDVA